MRIIKLFLVASFFIANLASASPVAEVSAREAVEKMQQAKNFGVLLDYVHWETAYKSLPAERREQLKVSSAAELRALYKTLIEDPKVYFYKNVESATQPNPITDMLAQGFAFGIEQAKERIVSAKYEITKISADHDNAIVEVTALGSLGQYQKRLPLIKVNNKWYLPSPSVLDSKGYLQDAMSGRLLQQFSGMMN